MSVDSQIFRWSVRPIVRVKDIVNFKLKVITNHCWVVTDNRINQRDSSKKKATYQDQNMASHA